MSISMVDVAKFYDQCYLSSAIELAARPQPVDIATEADRRANVRTKEILNTLGEQDAWQRYRQGLADGQRRARYSRTFPWNRLKKQAATTHRHDPKTRYYFGCVDAIELAGPAEQCS